MKSNYAHLILLDQAIYETHRAGYDPVKNVQSFWERYPLSTIHEYIIALQPKVNEEEKNYDVKQLSTFSVELHRTMIAYFMMHMNKVDLGKVSISMAVNREELKMTKKISDFFQCGSLSNTTT